MKYIYEIKNGDRAFFSKTMNKNVFNVIMKFKQFEEKQTKPVFITAYTNQN